MKSGIGRGPETPVETVPCAGKGCSSLVSITQTTLEFARLMNRGRKAQDLPLARKSEIALCPACYRKHRERLELETNLRTERDDGHWRKWLAGELTDSELLARVSDRSEYAKLLARVKSERGGDEPKKAKARKATRAVWQKGEGSE